MSPNSFQDIVPPERRSIRNIAPSSARSRTSRMQPENEAVALTPSPVPKRRKTQRRLGVFLVLVLILLLSVAGLSFVFAGSKVVVIPRQKDIVLEGTFEAQKGATAQGVLGYEIMTHQAAVEKKVGASGEEQVDVSAKGNIIIFNDFSSAEQRLVKNTRFESSSGLVYRIADSVTVPGQSTRNGMIVPGSVEAVVYADAAGADYNSSLTDFTIPGFKGDPRYEKFYARSKTPMEGGFSGVRPSVDEASLSAVVEELKLELSEKLRREAQTPVDSYLFEKMAFFSYEPATVVADDNDALVTLQGTLYGVLFNNEAFARFVADQTVAGYDGEPVTLEDVSTLTLELAEGENERPWENETISIDAAGTTRVIWIFSEETLKEDLAGRSKEALSTILSGYPSIAEAEVVLRPFWRQTFPEKPDEIAIEIKLRD